MQVLMKFVHRCKTYFINRFIDKTHIVSTGVELGKWGEWDERMFHACFNLLVDFIEKDLVNMDYEPTSGRPSGLSVLDWESKLIKDDRHYSNDKKTIAKAKERGEYGMPTSQALAAIKQKELYLWYKFEYPRIICNIAFDEAAEDFVNAVTKQKKLEELIAIRRTLWC